MASFVTHFRSQQLKAMNTDNEEQDFTASKTKVNYTRNI